MTEQRAGWWGVPAPQRKDLRNFAWVMAGAAALVGGLLWYVNRTDGMQVAWIISGVFLALGVLWPAVLKPLFIVWMALARLLSFVNTHLILALVFYTLFTLIGFCMRLVRYDPLSRKIVPTEDSYWHHRETPLLPREHYERQF